MIENARPAVTGHINIGPAVVVVVESRNAQRIESVRLGDSSFHRHILKRPVPAIVVQRIRSVLQPARSAHHGNALPHARSPLPRERRGRDIKIHVVCNHQIQLAVPVVVHERASRSPCLFRSSNASFVTHVLKYSVIIAEQTVVPVVRDVEIVPTIVVVIADAHSLPPPSRFQSRHFRHVGKRAVVIVVVKMIRRRVSSSWTIESGPVNQENIRPTVVVVVENRNARAGGLDNVFLCFLPAEDVQRKQPGFLCLVGKVDNASGFRLGTGHC